MKPLSLPAVPTAAVAGLSLILSVARPSSAAPDATPATQPAVPVELVALSSNAGSFQHYATGDASPRSQTDQILWVTCNGHIHEFCRDGGHRWCFTDLTASASAPGAALPATFAAYKWGDQMKQVVYLTSDGHVHELFCSGVEPHWTDADLTAIASAPAATAGTLSAYAWGERMKQVVYLTGNGHIHELCCEKTDLVWHDADLTAISAAPNARKGAVLGQAFGDETKGVIYISSNDDRLHEMCCESKDLVWRDHDIGAATVSDRPRPRNPHEDFGPTDLPNPSNTQQ